MLPEQLYAKITHSLASVREQGLCRNIRPLQFIDATHALDEHNNQILVMASNNYLGLTFEPSVSKAIQQALVHGSGSTGSRLTTGGVPGLSQLEKELAEFKHTEAALIYNTGYMANLGVISALADSNALIFSDELNHASIIDGIRLSKAQSIIYKHSDMSDLANKLQEYKDFSGNIFVVTDGVFSMDGDIAHLPEIVQLCEEYHACLIVDDAHAVGVLGGSGSGTAEYFGLQGRVPIQIGTLSKALAGEGGYVAADKIIIDYLRNKSRSFIFSTATSPLNAAAVLASLRYLKQHPCILRKLHQNLQTITESLQKEKIPLQSSATPIIPILVGDADLAVEFSKQLYEQGILINAIRPPTVEIGTSRLRLTVTAAHTPEQLQYVAQKIGEIYRKLKI